MDQQQTIFALLMGLVFGGSALAWWRIWQIARAGKRVLPWMTRTPVPWGLADLLATFPLLVLFPVLAVVAVGWIFEQPVEPDQMTRSASSLLAGAVGSLMAMVLAVILVRIRSGATRLDLGLDWRSITGDLRVGMVAFCLLVGPVLLIQASLVSWWPSRHPIIELIRENPDPRFLLVSALSAVVVAPVVEEFFFRVLLQGWLEKVSIHRGDYEDLLFGQISNTLAMPNSPQGGDPPEDRRSYHAQKGGAKEATHPEFSGEASTKRSGKFDTGEVDQREVAPVAGSQGESIATRRVSALARSASAQPWWPIAVSSAFFALLHYSHGPDPIPLFVFAIGLGYVYQRTHRLLPCIVVHALLNALSFGLLMVDVYLTA